jgi:hypothetical protein
MQERRLTQRWSIHKKVQIKLEGALNAIDCVCNDINFKGVCLSMRQHLYVDKFLKLTIMFSEGVSVDAQVWIVWHKRILDTQIYGLYFAKISDSDKESLYHYVHRYFPRVITHRWWQGLTEERGGDSMQQEQYEDKRTFSRFAVNMPLRLLDLNSEKEAEAETVDISAKGVGMLSNQRLKPHSSLEMWLQVPESSQPYYTRGTVTWSEKAGDNQYRSGIELEKADLMGMSRVLRTVL